GWAEQEFEAVRLAAEAEVPARSDPWRRTSGIHRVRNRRQLAAIRALWFARDEFAAQRDIAPGRVLPDSAIVDAVRVNPRTSAELAQLAPFGGPRQRRQLARWFGALEAARQLPDDELPDVTVRAPDNIPPAGRWRDRDPEAADRLTSAREAVTVLAAEHAVVVQNLLASDVVRRIAWRPPQPLDEATVATRLLELGARPWQVELCAAPLAGALEAAAA
ncbi:MAG TPA: HRDC domain-containing protein, partial [Jatrophihabitantaceae bacterium]|nr:HRDC domain-containing protein [Jatrophihabitantaceae bacterium]